MAAIGLALGTFILIMSKKRIFALLAVAIIVLAVWTNPKREAHYLAVKEKATSLVSAQMGSKENDLLAFGMQLFGHNLVDQFTQKYVSIDNYYLFSLTQVRWQGQETVVAVGAFNKIWFSSKIDDKFNEIIAVLKQL